MEYDVCMQKDLSTWIYEYDETSSANTKRKTNSISWIFTKYERCNTNNYSYDIIVRYWLKLMLGFDLLIWMYLILFIRVVRGECVLVLFFCDINGSESSSKFHKYCKISEQKPRNGRVRSGLSSVGVVTWPWFFVFSIAIVCHRRFNERFFLFNFLWG